MTVVVVATINPLPEHREEVRNEILASIGRIHAEEGCQLYALHDSDDALLIVEQWSNQSTLEAHGAGEPVQKVQAAISDKLAEPPSLVYGTPAPAGDDGKGKLVTVS